MKNGKGKDVGQIFRSASQCHSLSAQTVINITQALFCNFPLVLLQKEILDSDKDRGRSDLQQLKSNLNGAL